MTGLLVSVRDVPEADEALDGGASIIDVKEPNHGALGAADPRQWVSVLDRVGSHVPVSIALGELLDNDMERRIEQVPQVAFAKVGLAGCQVTDDWQERWRAVIESLPEGVRSVAVVYADWEIAQSPNPAQTIALAAQFKCAAVLLDTFTKQQGWLLDHLSGTELSRILDLVRSNGMKVVLAGSINRHRLPAVLEYSPDFIAVRGAACGGLRTDRVRKQWVQELVAGVASSPGTP